MLILFLPFNMNTTIKCVHNVYLKQIYSLHFVKKFKQEFWVPL